MTAAGVNSLKLLWRKGKITLDKLRGYVASGVIDPGQYESITGSAYQEEAE